MFANFFGSGTDLTLFFLSGATLIKNLKALTFQIDWTEI